MATEVQCLCVSFGLKREDALYCLITESTPFDTNLYGIFDRFNGILREEQQNLYVFLGTFAIVSKFQFSSHSLKIISPGLPLEGASIVNATWFSLQ